MAGITPRLRPRLEMTSTLTPAEIAALAHSRLDDASSPCIGIVADDQIDLQIRRSERRFWSPQLVVHVRQDADGRTSLTGHFGPNGNVWTMFMACYGFVVLSAIVMAFYGTAQMMMGSSAWAFWALPAAAVCVVLIYLAAGVGQRLGHDQTETLEAFLMSALDSDESEEEAAHA